MGREGRPSREIRLPAKLRDEAMEVPMKVFCVCRQPYKKGPFMIACDAAPRSHGCLEWVHGACVGISTQEAEEMNEYLCEPCQSQFAMKGRQNSGIEQRGRSSPLLKRSSNDESKTSPAPKPKRVRKLKSAGQVISEVHYGAVEGDVQPSSSLEYGRGNSAADAQTLEPLSVPEAEPGIHRGQSESFSEASAEATAAESMSPVARTEAGHVDLLDMIDLKTANENRFSASSVSSTLQEALTLAPESRSREVDGCVPMDLEPDQLHRVQEDMMASAITESCDVGNFNSGGLLYDDEWQHFLQIPQAITGNRIQPGEAATGVRTKLAVKRRVDDHRPSSDSEQVPEVSLVPLQEVSAPVVVAPTAVAEPGSSSVSAPASTEAAEAAKLNSDISDAALVLGHLPPQSNVDPPVKEAETPRHDDTHQNMPLPKLEALTIVPPKLDNAPSIVVPPSNPPPVTAFAQDPGNTGSPAVNSQASGGWPGEEARECERSDCTNSAPPGQWYCSPECGFAAERETLARKRSRPGPLPGANSSKRQSRSDNGASIRGKARSAVTAAEPVSTSSPGATQGENVVRQRLRENLMSALSLASVKSRPAGADSETPGPEAGQGEAADNPGGTAPKEDLEKLAREIAWSVEKDMYMTFGGVSKKYRERARSLVFNLRDPTNPELRDRVLSGVIPPGELCSMSAEQLASTELSRWRSEKAREAELQKELTEEDMAPLRVVKKTHKGEVELELPRDPVAETEEYVPEERALSRNTSITRSGSTDAKKQAGTFQADSQTGKSERPIKASNQETVEALDSISSKAGGAESDQPFIAGEDGTDNLPAIMSMDEYLGAQQGPKSTGGDEAVGSGSDAPLPDPIAALETEAQGGDKAEVKSDKEEARDQSSGQKQSSETVPEKPDARKGVVWDGTLQLASTSQRFHVAMSFCSGEKVELPGGMARSIELKGRVKPEQLDSYLRQLQSAARTRAIMIVEIKGDSRLNGADEAADCALLEAAENYAKIERFGLAEPSPGAELYLLPNRPSSLALLQSYGYGAEGLTAALLGVAVLRRTPTSSRQEPRSKSHAASTPSTRQQGYARKQVLSEPSPKVAVAEVPTLLPAAPPERASSAAESSAGGGGVSRNLLRDPRSRSVPAAASTKAVASPAVQGLTDSIPLSDAPVDFREDGSPAEVIQATQQLIQPAVAVPSFGSGTVPPPNSIPPAQSSPMPQNSGNSEPDDLPEFQFTEFGPPPGVRPWSAVERSKPVDSQTNSFPPGFAPREVPHLPALAALHPGQWPPPGPAAVLNRQFAPHHPPLPPPRPGPPQPPQNFPSGRGAGPVHGFNASYYPPPPAAGLPPPRAHQWENPAHAFSRPQPFQVPYPYPPNPQIPPPMGHGPGQAPNWRPPHSSNDKQPLRPHYFG